MKQIDFKKELLVTELIEKFRKQNNEVIPGDWKCVGIQVYFVDEEEDIMASPGLYSTGFNKKDYECDE